MRKALFAIVLVAASFAGGAIVNGPGLSWIQAMVLNRLGLDDASGSHEGDLATVGAGSPGQDENGSQLIPPLVTEPSENAPTSSSTSKGKDKAIDDAPASGLPPRGNAANAPQPKGSRARARRPTAAATRSTDPMLPGLAPVPEGAPAPVEPPTPLATFHEREVSAVAPATAEPGEDRHGRSVLKNQAPDRTGDPRSDPSLRRVALAADSPALSTSTPVPAAVPADWAEIRRMMRILGVSRYGIEGEPAGRVRFHCLIPLAGRRAVGQHFEAEGDDELQAAQATLRRVALWQATEGQPETP
jgi:hypothetical protein